MAKKQGGTFRLPLRSIGISVVFTAVVIVALLWLAGVFHRKIDTAPPGGLAQATTRPSATAEAHLITVPRTELAVGTIRAVHETAIAAKLLAKVKVVNVQAGKTVDAGDVLVELDDEDLKARLQQADAALQAATATRDQAQREFDRVKGLYESASAAKIEYDRAQTALQTATADVDGAQQARREAETILGYATIKSPMAGIVIDKQVEVGDTVSPGQTLLKLYDPTRMQLVASVRESLTQRLAVGQDIGVRVDALAKTCTGRISEIVPEAESASRTFAVKVTGPCPPGIYSGMFGRLLIPLDEQQVLVIPQQAVRHVGQLDLVTVVESDDATQRAVRLGRTYGDDVEVLAGLQAGEQVALVP